MFENFFPDRNIINPLPYPQGKSGAYTADNPIIKNAYPDSDYSTLMLEYPIEDKCGNTLPIGFYEVSLSEAKESNGDVTTAGIISAIKIIKTRKKGESMAFIKLFDETDEMEITIFPSLFAKSIQKLEKNNIIYVIGHNDRHESEKESFVAEKIENLEE